MGKRVEIECCIDCRFYHHSQHMCNRKGRKVHHDSIPKWCPLPDESSAARAEEVERLAERLYVASLGSEFGVTFHTAFDYAEGFIKERDRRRAEREEGA